MPPRSSRAAAGRRSWSCRRRPDHRRPARACDARRRRRDGRDGHRRATSRRCASATTTIAKAALGSGAAGGSRQPGPPSPPRSTARSTSSPRLLASLAALKELTPRTRDFVVSARRAPVGADVRGGAGARPGHRPSYVDATEIVFTDGPFGGASPNLDAHGRGGAEEAAAADRRGQGARSSRVSSAAPHRG